MSYKPRIIRIDDGEFYVEGSPEKKFCYRVIVTDEEQTCTCGDYTMEVKKDPGYRCEHLLAVLSGNGNIEGLAALDRSKPKLDERFISSIQGRDFVIYAGVLDLAHQRGLRSVVVDAVQYPTAENGMEAICKATVESECGETFVEWGDANPKNVNTMVVRHILRIAATRAKARALRDFTNIGMTCLEELGDLDEVAGNENGGNGNQKKSPPLKFERPAETERPKKPAARKEPAVRDVPKTPPPESKKEESKPEPPKQDNMPRMSTAQLKAIENLSRRRGLSREELEDLVRKSYGNPVENLGAAEASAFIRLLQQSA